MRSGLIIFYLLLCINGFTQDQIVLKSFVKEDTVQLRWAPMSVGVFQKGLENGYEITRIGSDGEKKFIVDPFKERLNSYLVSQDSFQVAMAEYVEAFLSAENEEDLAMPFAILSLSASAYRIIAEISGVYFEDTGLNKGKYEYRVKIKDSDFQSNEISVHSNKFSKNVACSELKGDSRIDLKEVYLYWEAKELNADYGGYWIYKSVDGKEFRKLNSTPLFHFTSELEPDKSIIDYVDTAVTEGASYFYKVVPINHFADPGQASNTIEVYIQKRLNGLCFIDTVKSNEFDRLISGGYSSQTKDEVVEYILYRSDRIDSTYTKLESLKTKDTTFSFNYKADLLTGDRHYFRVAAISIDGDTAMSYPYYHFSLDQEPPGIPTAFKGEIDSSGVVTLNWEGPNDSDLKGYRVFRANTLKEEFVEVSTFLSSETVFIDTLNLGTLTNEIYYSVRAVDMNYNNGPETEPLLLIKPDTIAPVAGSFRKFEVSEKGIYLEWHNSTSSDLSGQYLIRKFENQLDTILIFNADQDSILDFPNQYGITYTYLLIAEDKSGNTSTSKPLFVENEIGYRPAPKLKEAIVDRELKIIKLTWQPIYEEIYAIQIYRAKGEGKFKLYKTLHENVSEYEDKDLYINNKYRYKIKIVYQSGISSKMSEAIEVMY